MTLWNRKLIECGFTFGKTIGIIKSKNQVVIITTCSGWNAAQGINRPDRKVLKVMNHGNALPVIELCGAWVDHLGNHGSTVQITVEPGKIIITPVTR